MKKLTHAQALETLSLVPALFCHADFEGRFTWVAGLWEQALGFSHAELLSMPMLGLVHPDDRERTLQVLGSLRPGQALENFENRLRHKQGHYEWIRWNSHTAETYIASVALVVTEERLNAQRMAEQTALLRQAEEIAGVGQWRLNLADQSLHWSDEVYRIHGLSTEEPQPDVATAVSFYHPDDAPLVDRYVQESIETGAAFDFELRLIRLDGVERLVHSRGRVEFDDKQQPMTLLGTFQDITDARLLQRRLRDGERLASVSLLAAGIAHEINNPLQYVFANIGLAQEQLLAHNQHDNSPWTRKVNELLDDAMHGSKQVARIVSDLKSFMTPRQSGSAITDLGEVIKATINMTRGQVRHRSQMVANTGPIPLVAGDYAALVQVFINLLTNAAHAVEPLGPQRACIRVSTRTDPYGWAVVEVEDNGPGVPQADQVRIFEPFYSTKPVGVGSGLGLHISRGIVEGLGGALTLQSTPGLTVFQVRLPPAKAPEPTEVHAEQQLRVLIIDDDPRVAQTIARMLDSEYSCMVETDPQAGLATALRERPDAIVCDVMMPGMTGWELLDRAEPQFPEITARTLLISGAAIERHRPENAPQVGVLTKPFAPKALREALQDVLAARP